MFNDKILKSVAEAVKSVVDEALKGDQHKIDKNKNDKVDAHDFKLLRKEEAKKPASPFDWKNTPRQTAEKGEKTGHDAKKISTGTVYTKKYTKEEASQEEFNKEIKIAQDKSIGKSKAEVAKPAVQAVRVEEFEVHEAVSDKLVKRGAELSKKVKNIQANLDRRIAGRNNDDAVKRIQASFDKKMKTEQVEQLDELSKKTLGSYVKKAAFDLGQKGISAGQYAAKKKWSPITKNMNKRTDSIVKATDRLTKEEVEQLDELKKSTLASYVKKASHDVAAKGAATRQFANDSEAARKDSRYNDAKKSMDKADKTFAKSWKRRENMGKAVDRLAKEEVEHIEERSLSTGEKAAMEKNVKGMKKNLAGFKERYGKDAKSVMYATATKQAKGE
jgi:hypothetical protein